MLPFGSPMVDLRGLHNLLRTLCVPPPEAQASPMTRFIAKRGNGSGELYDPTVDDCHAAAAVVAVSLLPYEEGRAAMAPVGQAALEAQQICVDFHHSLPRSPDFFFFFFFGCAGLWRLLLFFFVAARCRPLRWAAARAVSAGPW